MRLNDMINEDQVNEFDTLKNIAGAFKGARSAGLKGAVSGAVSGYKASKSAIQGDAHSKRIVANLKADFMQNVGGGHQATYQNLIQYLHGEGLSGLENIPNPTKTVEPTPAQPTSEPVAEDTEPTLNNNQIDNIIAQAVKMNYNRIRLAQQGRLPADPEQPATPEPANTTPPATNNTASTTAAPQASTQTAPAPQAPPEVLATADFEKLKKSYAMLSPKERDQLRNEFDIIDDHERLASGTNESRQLTSEFHSKFLGTTI
jgi:hypothetical protein